MNKSKNDSPEPSELRGDEISRKAAIDVVVGIPSGAVNIAGQTWREQILERLSALTSVPELPNRPTLRADGICDKDGPIVDALYTEIDRLSSAPTGLTRAKLEQIRLGVMSNSDAFTHHWEGLAFESVSDALKIFIDAILESSSAPTPETE